MTNRTMTRSIFITGVGGGIGTATAQLFAAKGWRVGGCDLSTAVVESLADAVGRERFTPYVADVRDRAAVARAIDDFTARCGGKLGAVFANAGVLFMAPDDQVTPAQKDLQVDVNVKGVMHTFDAALPHLKRAAPGTHMIAMASTSAEYGSPHHAVYSATKFFVRGYTEALNIEYRPQGINVIGPMPDGDAWDIGQSAIWVGQVGHRIGSPTVAGHVGARGLLRHHGRPGTRTASDETPACPFGHN